jgi:hypothetical protein
VGLIGAPAGGWVGQNFVNMVADPSSLPFYNVDLNAGYQPVYEPSAGGGGIDMYW